MDLDPRSHSAEMADCARVSARAVGSPLLAHEQRIAFGVGGEYEGRAQVSMLSQIMGTFDESWLGIPPVRALAYLRFGFKPTGEIDDGEIVLELSLT